MAGEMSVAEKERMEKEDAEFKRTLENLWGAWLSAYDTDGSKTISLEELKSFASSNYTGSDGYMQTLFDWASGAMESGDLENAFKAVDTDGSGELEFEEFAKMLSDEPPEEEEAPPAPAVGNSAFTFASGLLDCCASNPEAYKVVAEIPNARLVEMRMPPGAADKPHDHPSHSMFFAKPAKLEITDYGEDGNPKGEPHVVEIPEGAPPIFPPGAHQVKNVGDTEALVLFVEQYPLCIPCGDVEGFVSPFEACPGCYKVLAENDDWVTGMVEMAPGESDTLHSHKDHLIYVLEGDEVTIYPDGNMEDPHAVPIKPEAGIPAPMSAGPIFAKHCMKNSGTKPIKMLFFEMKK